MDFKVNYQPVVPKTSIYHRSGWRDVMDSLEQLHNDRVRVRFIDLVENYYLDPRSNFINCHWIGVMHYVPGVPSNDGPSLESLFTDKRFKRDLFYCQGIYTLSKYLKEYLERQPLFGKLPIVNLYHPTDLTVPQFSMEKFKENSQPRLMFIGNQDRRLDRFYKLKTKYGKVWLSGKPVNEAQDLLRNKLLNENKIRFKEEENITLLRVNNSEYDVMLQKNLVMVDLYNSSANNTVIESIARSTPIFVNIVGGVSEYLGKDYPLYFNDISELESKLDNIELIEHAHKYLSEMDKSHLSFDTFIKSISKNNPIVQRVVQTNTRFSSKTAASSITGQGLRDVQPLARKLVPKKTNKSLSKILALSK